MRNAPLVSVCIQTYQHKKFIAAAIESALAQKTDFPYEIIIGEDDSTDGTREICSEFAKKHPDRIRLFQRSEADKIYIHGKKTGRFNFLSNLREARGEYIALLDGDDCWIDSGKLQKQVDFFSCHPGISICAHRYIKQMPGGKTVLQRSPYWKEEASVYPSASLLKEFYILMSVSMFRRSLVHELPAWFYEVPVIDYPLLVYLSQFGDIGYLPDIMTRYNIHKKGLWSGTKAPGNQVRIWHVLTLMSTGLSGSYGAEMEAGRERVGKELITFYKTHTWHRSGWLKKELIENRFAADRRLLQEYCRKMNLNESFKNIYNGVKEIARFLIRPFR
ncbi:MAG: glycosyltransferase family 2 protein [Bacteroidota bacterium]